MATFVTKRDSRKEEFDVEKIKKVIRWAIGDLDLNQLVLESKFDEFIKEDICTDDIHSNIIYHCRILCSPEQPEWSIVAGRLETMRRWSISKIHEKSFYYYLTEQFVQGVYKHPALKKYTKREINQLAKVIDQDRDLDHSYGSVLTAHSKYLMTNECIQQMHMANSMIIASSEDKGDRVRVATDVYNALSQRKISLATPWLSNLRANKNISSCFIIQVGDDMESIADNWKNAAMISKNGGGLGIDMSKIRAKGSNIGIIPNASKGITSWSKVFNDIAVSVDQGGKRAGAFTIHTPIWHRDIEDFIEIQSENGDFRKKAFDIFPQVGFMDAFMREVIKEDGGTWHTFCPHEVSTVLEIRLDGVYGKDFGANYRKCVNAFHHDKLKNVGVYNAKDLLKTIMRTQFETGLPYITFLDRINEANPNNHMGYIPCANLCTESYSVVQADKYAHTCNLASLVVGRIESDEEMIRLSALTCRILDNGIELTKPPIDISEAHNKTFRTIGIGIQGLHDYVARNDISWEDYPAFTKLAELIEYGAIGESIRLAAQRGPYPAYKDSRWHNGELMSNFKRHSVSEICCWEDIEKEMNEVGGIRNSQMTSPAPNTSTSIFMDASPGIMPVYSAFYNEDNRTGKFSVYGMFIKENPMSYERTAPRQDQAKLSKVVGSLQKFVDTGISAEYIFDLNSPDFTAKSLFELVVAAWKNKTKAIYYIRSIKKGETIDNITGGESICAGCTG